METFLLQRIARLRLGKQVTEYLNWGLKDILNLDFGQKIVIDGMRYVLMAIEAYSPLGVSAKTILLQDELQDERDLAAIQVSGLMGLVY